MTVYVDSMRALAVKHGAGEITGKQAGCMTMRQRKTGSLGQPEEAEAWVKTQAAERRAAA